jgi:hypothetical protein
MVVILKVRIENKGPGTTELKKSDPHLENYFTYLVGSENFLGRSQWPFGLRHELSSLARTLGSLVRIPLKASMFVYVCVYSVSVR